jgi:hypothetical protein
MGYLAPTLQRLMDAVDEVVKENKDNNPKIKPLIAILVAVRNEIKKRVSDPFYKEEELRDILLGAYELCRESSPKKSLFHQILTQKLAVNGINKISDKLAIVYLQNVYSFIADNSFVDHIDDQDRLVDDFMHMSFVYMRNDKEKIDTVDIKQRLIAAMKTDLLRLKPEMKKLEQAPPHENYIDARLATLHQDYHKAKEAQKKAKENQSYVYTLLSTTGSYLWSQPEVNETREFLSQLGSVLPFIIRPHKSDHQIGLLPRSQRIKLGMVMYGALSTRNDNSELHKLCCRVFDRTDVSRYDVGTVYSCLTSFQSFIKDNNVLEKIEQYGESAERAARDKDKGMRYINFLNDIDGRVRRMQIHKELEQMIDRSLENTTPTRWKATKTMAEITQMVMQAPFYGTGFCIGYGVSKTELAQDFIGIVSIATKKIGRVLLGAAGGQMGYFAADFITEASSERLFAQVLEKLGKLIGYTTGGVMGLTFDLSIMGLSGLCQIYLYLHTELKDFLISDEDAEEDRRFVKALPKLPDEALPQTMKARIEKGLGRNIEPALIESFEKLEEIERSTTPSLNRSFSLRAGN